MRAADLVQQRDLIGVLGEIAEATDVATALNVAAHYGGTRMFLPAAPEAHHALARVVGVGPARAIAARLGAGTSGLDILIPLGPFSQVRARLHLRQKLIDQGLPKEKIARMTGCSARAVQMQRTGRLKSVARALAQGDLFD